MKYSKNIAELSNDFSQHPHDNSRKFRQQFAGLSKSLQTQSKKSRKQIFE